MYVPFKFKSISRLSSSTNSSKGSHLMSKLVFKSLLELESLTSLDLFDFFLLTSTSELGSSESESSESESSELEESSTSLDLLDFFLFFTSTSESSELEESWTSLDLFDIFFFF